MGRYTQHPDDLEAERKALIRAIEKIRTRLEEIGDLQQRALNEREKSHV